MKDSHPSDRGRGVARRRAALVSTACLAAAVDLVHKAAVPASYHHLRSEFVVLIGAAVIVALGVLAPRLPSRAAAVGAGLAAGGAIGNLVSLLAWSDGVPDPLVITGSSYGIAFNLADVFALAGDTVLLSAAVLYALRNRPRLRDPV
jgi:Signal peptidase (SPase) II